MMADLTPDRLQELRRIAEAATPGPWEWDKYLHLFSSTGKPVLTKPFSPDNPDVVEAMPEDLDYIERFNPETSLALLDRIETMEQERDAARAEAERWKQQYEALLDEIERLRREREVMAEVLKAVHERDKHVHTCDHCECALCPEGAELSYKAYIAQWIYSKGGGGA